MTTLHAARVVTPLGVLEPGTIVLDGDRIAEVRAGAPGTGPAGTVPPHTIVPGFVDVHVHGTEGYDTLATDDGVQAMAARLPRYGVTAFCPTTVACPPDALRRVLEAVRRARRARMSGTARVLPAHLESNFINPACAGAQPTACLCLPPAAGDVPGPARTFDGAAIFDEISTASSEVAIVTLAPELPGGLDLVRALTALGHRVSVGHSDASYEQGLAAVAAGARHATHLFNRMPPLSHRAPGLAGAVFDRPEMMAELILDGHHVHPAIARMAIAALGPERGIAITDGTAAVGLPAGTRTRLGSQTITAGPDVARLDDGTFAGSVLTMDAAFRNAVTVLGLDVMSASRLCAGNPARALGLADAGAITAGARADLAVLDADFRVLETYVAGVRVYEAAPRP